MNAPSSSQARQKRAGNRSTGSSLGQKASGEARRRAAVVLEVLAGVRTPGEAASALGLAVPRYYQIEQRALAGLVAACEPAVRGRQATPQRQVAALERQIERLSRDSARYQSLARLAQRSLGVTPVASSRPDSKPSGGKKRRQRRPTVRALRMAAALAADSSGADSPADVKQTPANS